MKTALIVIDVQNDYFPNGNFPLEGAEDALAATLAAIAQARSSGELVITIQHVAPEHSPLMAKGTAGVALHPAIADAVAGGLIITKTEADSFLRTELGEQLRQADITTLRLVGMMTQNCVTHTALSPDASGFDIEILGNACAAPTRTLHNIALAGLGGRLRVI